MVEEEKQTFIAKVSKEGDPQSVNNENSNDNNNHNKDNVHKQQ